MTKPGPGDGVSTMSGSGGEAKRRIQLIVSGDGDRRALTTLLEDRYEVVVDDDLQPVDCYLVGDRTLGEYHAALRAMKTDQHPTFCPVVLMQRPETQGSVRPPSEQGEDSIPLVDEVVAAPVDRSTLYRRLQNLLARRRQSVALSEKYANSQLRFQRLFDSTNDAIFVLTGDEIIESNRAASELSGYSREELRSLDPTTVIQGSNETLQSFLQEVRDTGEESTGELTCTTKHGERRHLEVSGATLSYEGSEAVVLSARDITERKEREQELQLFRKAVETVGQAVMITDREGTIEYINPAFETQTGYSRAEAIGSTPRVLKSGKQPESFYATLWETILDGERWEAHIINKRKSGELYQVRQEISPITDAEGTITHFVSIESDVTDRKLREQQLSVLNRVLRHNLRNGMNVIEGNAALLGDGVDDPQLQSFVTSIEERTAALAQLSEKAGTIDSLFDHEPPADAAYDLRELFAAVAASFEERYPEAVLSVADIDPIAVRADSRLKVALAELLDNAVDHNDRPTPEVGLTATPSDGERSGEWVDIIIVDNGRGIPEQERATIEMGDETPLQHGTGLGLWLVYWTVSLLGGEVTITESSPGTRVVLTLPRAVDPESPQNGGE
ncbi:MAG: PAS domain S-box protein [Euryarchaeota archaeon]|nr:PAS domain S-box protein [Euryarchaeota archaeon]